MSRHRPLVLVILMFALSAVATPVASAGGGPGQRVEGRIQEASGYLSGECRFEVHRISVLTTNQPSVVNGVVGHSFEVDSRTAGGRFMLRPTNDVPRDADLDIAFYESLGELTDPLARPARVVFDKRGPLSIERGRVPKDFPIAIVCLHSAETPALFTYTSQPASN